MKDNFDISNLKRPKKINSRTKGNTFERKVCKLLNAKFNTEEFQRSPGSGAFGTTHTLPAYLQIHGDIITPSNFLWTIECKKGYNKISLGDLFSKDCEIYKFYQQAERACSKSLKEPLLIIQQDRKDVLCVFKSSLYLYFGIKLPHYDLSIGLFEDFLKVI